MKAMLLAAGRGERLRPLTDHTAKPLLNVAGKSLIEHHLSSLQRAGITDVVINTCWQADKIVEHLGDGARYDMNIVYSHEQSALETAGGIIQALPLLGKDHFLVISTDIWCEVDYTSLIRPPAGGAQLLMVDNPEHHPLGDFSLNNGLLSNQPTTRLTYSGVGLFDPNLFIDLPLGHRPLREVFKSALARNILTGQYYNRPWFDVGTLQRLNALEAFLTQN